MSQASTEQAVPVFGLEESRESPSGFRIITPKGAGPDFQAQNLRSATSTVVEEAGRAAHETALATLTLLGVGSILGGLPVISLQNLTSASSKLADGYLAVRAMVRGENEIARLGGNFNDMTGNIAALVRRLERAVQHNQEFFLETITRLAAAVDAKDPYSRGHSDRVSSISSAISCHLGLAKEEVLQVRIAAILHDIGKLGIRESILNKPGGLSDDEFEIMRQHPSIGAHIITPIQMLEKIVPGIRNHHETWDGQGYPDQLGGEEISMVARIIGVADTFDAMTTNRSYQQAMTLDYVLAAIRSMAGTRFDPVVVDAFIAAVEAGDVSPPSSRSERRHSHRSVIHTLHQSDSAVAGEGLTTKGFNRRAARRNYVKSLNTAGSTAWVDEDPSKLP